MELLLKVTSVQPGRRYSVDNMLPGSARPQRRASEPLNPHCFPGGGGCNRVGNLGCPADWLVLVTCLPGVFLR